MDLDVTPNALLSADSTESVVDPPVDFSIDGSLVADNTPETAASVSDFVPLVTSPMGPALVDSDDELIATRLPSYLNSFKPCEVSVQQFLSFVFLFPFLTFSLFVRFWQVFHFSSFSHFLNLSNGVFSLFAFLVTFRNFSSLSHLVFFLLVLFFLLRYFFQLYISFSSFRFFFVIRLYFLMKILFYIIFSSLRVNFLTFFVNFATCEFL